MTRSLAAAALLAVFAPYGLIPHAEAQDSETEEQVEDAAPGYTPPAPERGLVFGGYLDVGFADAEGDGTSFHAQDGRLPADYGVDTFAPAVSSRGDVASADSGGRFTNGFLPRSLDIGGRPSVFVNTASFDVRYEAPGAPVMLFSRVQLLPRFGERGSETRLLLDQAFGRVTPFETHELTLSAGKSDPVFGIEYLEREANLRTGITPSLFARYTTGTPVGAKVFYRTQIAPLWSAVSVNLAATNGAPFVEALQPAEVSLTGRPVASGRLGYELNLPRVQLKIGGSAMVGPRNDQGDPDAGQRAFGGDARLTFFGLSLSGELLRVDQDPGRAADKRTGAGAQTIASGFHARGFYAQAGYELPFGAGFLRKTTVYGRVEQRHAWFDGFLPITVRRLTGGARLDLWDVAALKIEYLANLEVEGAPTVANNVVAASAVLWF